MSKTPTIPGRFHPIEVEIGGSPERPSSRRIKVQAFVPDTLPPTLDLPALHFELHQQLIDAERGLSRLEGTALRLTNPHILIGPFSRREAILSSAIEDTFTTIEDLARVEANLEPTERRDDAIEVRNYVRALEHGLNSELPLSLRLIRQLHSILLDRTRGRHRDPGSVRKTQNFIGFHEDGPRFVPPPANFVPDLLSNLEHFIHNDSRIPDLVRVAIVHYQFEAIHPFLDGNGRVGRLLITLQLCERTSLTKPLVYVSGFFEKHRAGYYDCLLKVSQEGRWINWFRFFLEAVTSQAADAQRRADELLTLQQQLHDRIRVPRASSLLSRIVDGLFEKQWLTVAEVAKDCDVTPAAANGLVKKLESLGVIREVTGQNYGRVWFAPEILAVIRREYDAESRSLSG